MLSLRLSSQRRYIFMQLVCFREWNGFFSAQKGEIWPHESISFFMFSRFHPSNSLFIEMALRPDQIMDELDLKNEPAVQKLLAKEGPGEVIQFSDLAVKINRKDKEQTRVLLITDKGIYNLLPNNYKLKRRINLSLVMALSVSTVSDEFVIHVDGEYDYRYKSSHKQDVINILNELYREIGRASCRERV